jgi:hypothetical protein
MINDEISDLLIDAGLQESAVNTLLDEYEEMQSKFKQQEYAGVGMNVGHFCEAVIHILRVEIDSELKSETVREFAQECLQGDIAEDYPRAIQQHIPNMLNTAWDIRSNRDAAHMNLEIPVNRADARLGIALCSSMLIELIREFGAEGDQEDINRISEIIEKISATVEENPLDALVKSKYEFNEEEMGEILEDKVTIVEEENEVEPGPEFFELDDKNQIVALALGRLAAYNRDMINETEIGERKDWFADRANPSKSRCNNLLRNLDCIKERERQANNYFIPGYQVPKAIGRFRE